MKLAIFNVVTIQDVKSPALAKSIIKTFLDSSTHASLVGCWEWNTVTLKKA